MALTRETLKKLKPVMKEIPVPELGEKETTFVLKLGSEGLATILMSANKNIKPDDIPGVMARMSEGAQQFLCDAEGELLYEDTPDDLKELRLKFPFEALFRVYEAGMTFNGLDDASNTKREGKLKGPLGKRSSGSRVSGRSLSTKQKRTRRKKKS